MLMKSRPSVLFMISAYQMVLYSRVCRTPGCVKAAAEVLSNLDQNVDPCDDFYKFACGGWMNRHFISSDKPYVSVFSEVQDDVNLKLRVLLEEKLDGSKPPFVKMIKELYDTCMDVEAIEQSGSEPLKKVLKSLGGWPVLEGRHWNDSNFDWIQMLASFRKLGYSHDILLYLSVIADYRNNTVHIIKLDETSLSIHRTHLLRGLDDSVTAAYFKWMVKSAKLLGVDEKTAKDELLKVLNFEIALAKFTLPSEERRNFSKLYNKYTVKELQKAVPQIPWLKYLNGLLSDEIHENETLLVIVPEFLKNFVELISKTEERVVANYMLWRAVGQSTTYLSRNWRDVGQKFFSVAYGESDETPRWKQCIGTVTEHLGIALSSYYVRHYFKEETKDGVSELVKYIHSEFLNILEENDWMDQKTKEQAIAKSNNIKAYIGYPAELLNDTAVLEFHRNLKISKESHFENIMRLEKWKFDYKFSRLRKPNIKGEWIKHAKAVEVNGFYKTLENSIDFPAAILQNAFFNKDRPHYMNFGGIGFIIGHEITHGFDDKGRQFDKNGNNVNWWAKTTDEHFKNKTQCIIDQYSSYTVENGMKVNGVTTQGENIADNGGMKAAYWAYQSWVKDKGREKSLPGLNYSHNQLFWISAANAFCDKYGPAILNYLITTGSHSPKELRIIGTMSNLAEFAKDFNCSRDSPMNKQPKCKVW